VTGSHDQDYSRTTEDGWVILTAAVSGPAGFAVLGQEIDNRIQEPGEFRPGRPAESRELLQRAIRS